MTSNQKLLLVGGAALAYLWWSSQQAGASILGALQNLGQGLSAGQSPQPQGTDTSAPAPHSCNAGYTWIVANNAAGGYCGAPCPSCVQIVGTQNYDGTIDTGSQYTNVNTGNGDGPITQPSQVDPSLGGDGPITQPWQV